MLDYLKAHWPAGLSPVSKFVPREKFVETVSDAEYLWIAYIDSKLKGLLNEAPPEINLPTTALQIATISGNNMPPNPRLIDDLNLYRLVPYGNVHQLLTMQPRGNKGRLHVNGWGTFAPVAVIGGFIQLMSMQYFDREAVKNSPVARTMHYARNGWVLGLVNIEENRIRRGERICYHLPGFGV